MDGVLAEYKWSGKGDEWKQGHFLSLAPDITAIHAVRDLAKWEDVEVYILSALLPDSDFCKAEKMVWLIRYLPEINDDHWIFTKAGIRKPDVVRQLFGGMNDSFVLLDDYSANLAEWESAGGTGIKYRNGINGRNGTWSGLYVDHRQTKEEMETVLLSVMEQSDRDLDDVDFFVKRLLSDDYEAMMTGIQIPFPRDAVFGKEET